MTEFQNPYTTRRVIAAYKQMAKHYRPLAPSDGLGHVLLSKEELADPRRLEQEAKEAALQFVTEDNDCNHVVHGCANGNDTATMFYCLRVAELCCAGADRNLIAALLKLALKEVEQTS
jgi:hypothetical protein